MVLVLVFAVLFDVGDWLVDRFEGWPVEGAVILVVLLLNATLGTLQEHRSEKALLELKRLTAPLAWVIRDGALSRIPSREVVPGDTLRIEAGERVVADGDLVSGEGVMLDESILSGESVPVEKALDATLLSGTLIVRGKGVMVATKTGPESAMGRIATMLATIESSKTPLERRLDQLGRSIAHWITALTVLLIVGGIAVEGIRQLDEIVMFAVALAVAAIPEGMPAVVSLTLALGVQRMAKRNALVRRLSAVESLGTVSVIGVDKTGTLTENKMTVHDLVADDQDEALRAVVLANDADLGTQAGDPLEIALLEYAAGRGIDIALLHESKARVDARPFDSAWRFMRVTVRDKSETTSYVKGAPEAVLSRVALTPEENEAWHARAEQAAREGYRVLAIARGAGAAENDLTLLGLVKLWDPPRAEVPEAIAAARRAGIRVVMITGDHPGTARAIADSIGLPGAKIMTGDQVESMTPDELCVAARNVNVFARVDPSHKLRLVEALRADGQIVAMTGDGVNDAPALKRADVGVAMGKRGSDVAREVADLVLLDDNFATIVTAVEEGRTIYENIQSFIRFTFSTNVGLMVLVVTGAVMSYLAGIHDANGFLLVPLTALELLWINFLGDGPPALALAIDRAPGNMDRPPRPAKAPLLDRASTQFIAVTGAFKGAVGIALLVVLPVIGYAAVAVQTAIFLYESIGKLVSVYPARRTARGRFRNIALHIAVGAGIGLQILTLVIPGLREFLSLSPLDNRALIILAAAVFFTWAVAVLANRLLRPTAETPLKRETRRRLSRAWSMT